MSKSFVDQVTLDFLLNKEVMGKHVMRQREKQINKEDLVLYKKEITDLFMKLTDGIKDEDITPDIKYAFDNFIKISIQHFKMVDEPFEEEYIPKQTDVQICDADKQMLMRSVKMDAFTLDKYIKKKKKVPVENEINFSCIKNNIINMYEDEKDKKQK